MESNNQQSFFQFSDELRVHTSNLANLSLNDSIWSVNSYPTKKTEDRRNFDIRVGGNLEPNPKPKGNFVNNNNTPLPNNSDFNSFNNGWKLGSGINLNGGKSGVDKRFKTLPPSEALPRNETVGGYIFVCNNDTMEENLKRHLFGLPPRYRDSVRQITPGLPLFLYNYSTHQLHGIYEAASFGGTNIDPSAWEDKKNPGESRFPAQVRVQSRKLCEPLDEDAFRPILHHYDGPKFRLELSVPEALSLLDIFDETKA
uniref:DCD domain-containing protein n=1 Tax=Chenopodium quinoa TaxID=63459 RepID=A0A803LWL8_CHEQI